MSWPAARTLLALGLVALVLGSAPEAAAAAHLEDLLWDLQVIPLDREDAPGFSLEGLDGAKASLADVRGRAILLYFWATW